MHVKVGQQITLRVLTDITLKVQQDKCRFPPVRHNLVNVNTVYCCIFSVSPHHTYSQFLPEKENGIHFVYKHDTVGIRLYIHVLKVQLIYSVWSNLFHIDCDRSHKNLDLPRSMTTAWVPC